MMKLAKRAAALVLAAVLALSLTACSPKEVASNLILKTADLLGLREEGSDDDEADEIVAQPGGEVNFPDGLQDTSVHWNQQVQDGTLYVAFNSIQNRNTEYFVAGSDTVQVTGYGTTESTGILEFKVALWELSEDKATTSYVAGTTVYFPTGGECTNSLRLSQALMAAGRKHTFLPLNGITHMTNDETVARNLLLLQRDFLADALA